MRTHRFVPELVDAELRKFIADAFPELLSKEELGRVVLEVIDMNVEAASEAVGDARGEFGVGLAADVGLGILEGFAVFSEVVWERRCIVVAF